MLRADPVELALYVELAHEAQRYAMERDKALARLVVNELAGAMKRGR